MKPLSGTVYFVTTKGSQEQLPREIAIPYMFYTLEFERYFVAAATVCIKNFTSAQEVA